jgi:hypothetical protein
MFKRNNKENKKAFIDNVYTVNLEGVPGDDCKYKIRIEGNIIEETDKEYKFKSKHSFWSGWSFTCLEYPKNSVARHASNFPSIKRYYWVEKDRVTLIK